MPSEISKILRVSANIKHSRSVSTVYMALGEELGEITKCLTKPDKVDEHISGEIADLIIAAVDLLYVYNRHVEKHDESTAVCETFAQLDARIPEKLAKWVRKYAERC